VNNATALYVRVSSLDQRQDSQVKELKNHCRLRKWTNLVFYQDKLSGAAVARPELDRMMRDVRAGRIERVVCFKLDRLGRSVAHLALLMEELIRLHVPLVVMSQGIDTSEDNAAGRLQAHVIMAMAEFERSLIRERVRAGLAAARERGVRLGREPMPLEASSGITARRPTTGRWRRMRYQLPDLAHRRGRHPQFTTNRTNESRRLSD